MSESHCTVLLCSAGRRPYLARWFREGLALNGAQGKVFVADADRFAAAQSASDGFIHAPACTHPSYRDWLSETLDHFQVDLALSFNDYELSVWSTLANSQAGRLHALFCLAANIQSLVEDKYSLAKRLSAIGVRTPPTLTGFEALGQRSFPDAERYIVKSRYGSGSVGLQVAGRNEVVDAIKSSAASALDKRGCPIDEGSLKAVVVQPCILGTEYGIDVINDIHGRYVVSLARQKLAMRFGETEKATTSDTAPFLHTAYKVASITSHRGLIDTDMIVDERGQVWVIDVNPRFGGGYPFSHAADANIPAALVAWTIGRTPRPEWLRSRIGVTGSKAVEVVVAGGQQ